ncbi:hypothetical protein [Thorsellia kenyensis]|uniref:Riboflavin synthase n=1 Tax=Thorsellia kenyensis TaxID=1549888 RepID=A0ABV6CAA2_9GAMM
MFSGKNQILAKVLEISDSYLGNSIILDVTNVDLSFLTLGSILNINGSALPVTALSDDSLTVELLKENLRTNLSHLKVNDLVGIEKPLKHGDEISPLILKGQIACQAIIKKIYTSETNHQIWLKLDREEFSKYLFAKIAIGVDGYSVGISELKQNQFCIHIPKHLMSVCLVANKKLHQMVNVEFNETIIATVETVYQVIAMTPANNTANGSIAETQ